MAGSGEWLVRSLCPVVIYPGRRWVARPRRATRGVALPRRGLGAVSGDVGEPAMKPLAQLVRAVLALGAALAGHRHAGGGYAGEPCESDELPAHTHQFA
jgi:hypothetical protein